jgi:hypothetical protein
MIDLSFMFQHHYFQYHLSTPHSKLLYNFILKHFQRQISCETFLNWTVTEILNLDACT